MPFKQIFNFKEFRRLVFKINLLCYQMRIVLKMQSALGCNEHLFSTSILTDDEIFRINLLLKWFRLRFQDLFQEFSVLILKTRNKRIKQMFWRKKLFFFFIKLRLICPSFFQRYFLSHLWSRYTVFFFFFSLMFGDICRKDNIILVAENDLYFCSFLIYSEYFYFFRLTVICSQLHHLRTVQ